MIWFFLSNQAVDVRQPSIRSLVEHYLVCNKTKRVVKTYCQYHRFVTELGTFFDNALTSLCLP